MLKMLWFLLLVLEFLIIWRAVSILRSGGPASAIRTASLKGDVGLTISGSGTFGDVISYGGDINGDGFDDIFVSGGAGSGRGYVIFGGSGVGEIDTSNLDGSNGFAFAGFGFSGIGDINKDGYGDFIVLSGTSSNFKVNVVYGTGDGFSGELDLSSSDGFEVTGASLLSSGSLEFSALGDVDGDGVDDFGIGSGSGVSLILGR